MGDRDVDEEDEIEIRQAPRAPTEGVRIIGAEEAQTAIETGQAAGKRPDDELRFGDVPPPPEQQRAIEEAASRAMRSRGTRSRR